MTYPVLPWILKQLISFSYHLQTYQSQNIFNTHFGMLRCVSVFLSFNFFIILLSPSVHWAYTLEISRNYHRWNKLFYQQKESAIYNRQLMSFFLFMDQNVFSSLPFLIQFSFSSACMAAALALKQASDELIRLRFIADGNDESDAPDINITIVAMVTLPTVEKLNNLLSPDVFVWLFFFFHFNIWLSLSTHIYISATLFFCCFGIVLYLTYFRSF